MQTYRVKSISEYLSIIESKEMSEFAYRGQNEPYFSIEASGFRPYMGGWDSDKIVDMDYLHKAFYNRVVGQISEHEKSFFLAFCQHYGIPTNLVDMSYSPLVALFFACEGKGIQKFSIEDFLGSSSIDDLEKDVSLQEAFIHNLVNQAKKPFYSKYAQIYMIKKERLINITDIVVELNGKNLFDEITSNEKIALMLLDSLANHFSTIENDMLIEWVNNLLSVYCSVFEVYGETDLNDPVYIEIKKNISKKVVFQEKEYYRIFELIRDEYFVPKGFSQLISENSNRLKGDMYQLFLSKLYFGLIVKTIEVLKNFPRKINIDLDVYFTYQAPELFDRITNQRSFFIYQPYVFANDGMYDYGELNLQQIKPDVQIEVENYSKILEELDQMGINRGSIYGDIDNVAKSIIRSSSRLLKANLT